MLTPDIRLLDGVVDKEVIRTMQRSSRDFTKRGFRHSIIGSLALGCYGMPRPTPDVDYLVDDKTYHMLQRNLRMYSDTVVVQISPAKLEVQKDILDNVTKSKGIPVTPIEGVFFHHLRSFDFPEDTGGKYKKALLDAIRCGIDTTSVRPYIFKHAPHLVRRFDVLLMEAFGVRPTP